MNQTSTSASCKHVEAVELLTYRSNAALRHGSTVGVVSAKVLGDEQMLACQAECGAASPWHGKVIEPTPREQAVALLRTPSIFEMLGDDFREIGAAVRSAFRRLTQHPAKTE